MNIATGVCKYSSLTVDAKKRFLEESIETSDFWPPNVVKLLGYKHTEQQYFFDNNADFSAIIFPELQIIHIVSSTHMCRCKRCAPCHPIHGAVDEAGNDVVAYTLHADFFINPLTTITQPERN